MNPPAMSHRRHGEVPAQVAGQRLSRHRRRAVLADLLTSAAPPLRGDEMHYRQLLQRTITRAGCSITLRRG